MGLVLRKPALLVVSDGSGDAERVLALGRAALRGGAWGYSLREPGLGGRDLMAVVETLVAGAREEPGREEAARILVSDRVDVALAAGAFGVQLGERAMPVARVRAWVGERLGIGRSVHDVKGAREAAEEGADWLLFGHVYATRAKGDLAPAGPDGLRAAVAAAGGLPLFAIGGVTAVRVDEVLGAGARGVAVIGAVADAQDPERAVTELARALAASSGTATSSGTAAGSGAATGGHAR